MHKYLIEMKNITKQFGGETVLESVDFKLRHGEIHGLLGENGAGKSVLMKILTGVHIPDVGSILIDGEYVQINDPINSKKLGINAIYQDINLVPELSVAENIFFGNLPLKFNFPEIVDWKKIRSDSEAILKRLNFKMDVMTPVKNLSLGQKHMVEIARALSKESRVIILDEPNTGLSEQELEFFYSIIKNLKSSGISFIFISHMLEDVLKLCDSITILREGKLVADSINVHEIDRNNIIKIMIGKNFKDNYPKLNSKPGRVVLRVKSICTQRGLKNVSFDLRKGEILGIAGLQGSGRTAIGRALFGIDRLLTGELYLNGTRLILKSPRHAINAQIAYLTEDRVEGGIEQDFGIPENISLSNLKGVSSLGLLKRSSERNIARHFIKKFNIKASRVVQKVMELSSGNQQKVLLSKWMFSDSTILILDEPTKGVDKSTKVEIYNFMNKYILDGSSVIFISSDLQELMGMSDRILVLCGGEIKREFSRNEFSMEEFLLYASGTKKT
jgi:ribose transport system ATP-binding protein